MVSMNQGEPGLFMRKEILEQPESLVQVAETVGGHLGRRRLERPLGRRFLSKLDRVIVMGSGSSFHAALLARDYLEALSGVSARAVHASESFRQPAMRPRRTLALALSHSGSSSDVRAAVGRAHEQGIRVVGLTNIPGSALVREADATLVSGAGEEAAIPSTKGFTGLVASSLLLAAHAAEMRGRPMKRQKAAVLISRAAVALRLWLATGESTAPAAKLVARASSAVFLGKGWLYPVARDGALKLLEIAYLPALAYPPEEFRHGPIALAEKGFVLLVLAGPGRNPSLRAIAKQVRAMGGEVVLIGNRKNPWASVTVPVPRVDPLATPFLYAPPLQLIALQAGVRLGRPIDRPRGLSKVVGAD